METFGQWFVFALGVAAVAMSVAFWLFFRRSSTQMAQAMQAFLVEQFVSGVGTLLFSSNSLLATISGVPESEWNNMSPLVAQLIRLVMFGAMLHSTLRLGLVVRRVVLLDRIKLQVKRWELSPYQAVQMLAELGVVDRDAELTRDDIAQLSLSAEDD